MAILFSKEFSIAKEVIREKEVFDVFLDKDSPFFINIKRLQATKIPEFANAYDQVLEYFRQIAILLKASSQKGDKLYRAAFNRFYFPEVNGINLGFSAGTRGAGFGKELRQQIISDAFDIIKAGTECPEIFLLSSLFEDNVGPDRLRDMIAGIIFENIKNYTKRLNSELGITQERLPKHVIIDGILFNEYKKQKLYLLPAELLHELPIARDWDDISRVCRENEAICAEVNAAVANEWHKMSSAERKKHLKENIFMEPEKAGRVVQAFKEAEITEYDVFKELDYLIDYLLAQVQMSKKEDIGKANSFAASMHVLENYKHWVEFSRGASIIQSAPSRSREKVVQRLLHGFAYMFCKEHNWDISPEEDGGRGPVDFKISRGNDKTVIEIKLSSNDQCVHGYDTQIEEYAAAENTENKIFVLVDLGGHSKRVENVYTTQKLLIAAGKKPAELFYVDARNKQSASTYQVE